MLACVSMCLLGPALAYAGGITGLRFLSLVELSPVMAVRTLGRGGSAPLSPQQWHSIGVLGLAAAAGWLALGVRGTQDHAADSEPEKRK